MKKCQQLNSRRKALRMKHHHVVRAVSSRPPRSSHGGSAAQSFLALMFQNTTALNSLQRVVSINKKNERLQRTHKVKDS